MGNVTAYIGRDHYRINITAGKNTIVADEPEDQGGKDEGMNPYELLLSALGACTCATLRMYADRKQMPLESIAVTLSLERDEEKNTTHISRHISLSGALSDEDKKRLHTIAEKCPVHKVLSNPLYIQTQLN